MSEYFKFQFVFVYIDAEWFNWRITSKYCVRLLDISVCICLHWRWLVQLKKISLDTVLDYLTTQFVFVFIEADWVGWKIVNGYYVRLLDNSISVCLPWRWLGQTKQYWMILCYTAWQNDLCLSTLTLNGSAEDLKTIIVVDYLTIRFVLSTMTLTASS